MPLLLETLRLENGIFDNPELHRLRMENARSMLFGVHEPLDLENHLRRHSGFVADGLWKCRVVYAEAIRSVEFLPYQRPLIRSLKLVNDNHIEYSYKFFDRSRLESLWEKRAACDDILIVKNGLITDTSFANILFFNGKQWLTPARPLLRGTRRRQLLEEERISTAEIRPGDLKHFRKARLVNAMLRFEDEVDVEIDRIISEG